MDLNFFDIGVAVIILLLAIRGGVRGFVAEVAGLLGLIAGLLLATAFFPVIAEYLAPYIPQQAAPAAAFISLVLLGMLGVALIARLLQHILRIAFASGLNHFLGIGAGAFKGVITCTALAYAAWYLMPQLPFEDSLTFSYLMKCAAWAVDTWNINLPLPVIPVRFLS